MKNCYFLGANSKDGFYSLYDSFPPHGAKLHIIKSGPGTGKSSFMRKIAAAAEAKGMDVEYILCSGDPASLDGVYITQLNSAWVDGTAPHVTEPRLFGVNSDYVNLGRFLNQDFSPDEKERIQTLNIEYKQHYKAAYDYLGAAARIRKACMPELFDDNGRTAIKRRVNSILKRNLGHGTGKPGSSRPRFISAVSCMGEYRLNCSVNELCKLKYQFDCTLNGLSFAMDYAASEAIKRGAEIIVCPSPLDPEQLEAVLIPSHSLALLGCDWGFTDAKSVHIDNLADTKKLQDFRAEIKEGKKLEKKTMELAYGKLQSAKALHDQLEELYIGHMDFSALSEYTDNYIKALLH